MKRILSIILIVAMVISMAAIMPLTVTAEPVGTAVSDAAGFAAMSADGQYYLTANITVSATYTTTFTGTLDGNGKTITTSVPLFNEVSGTIKNLTVGGTIDYSAELGHVGAVAKVANGATFENVTNNASVKGYTTTADAANIPGAGGVVGLATGNCIFTTVSNTGDVNGYNAGGIAGMVANSATGVTAFTGCTNSGTIKADSTIIPNTPILTIKDGKITATGIAGAHFGTGGIVGMILDYGKVYFDSCSNSGVINNSAVAGTKIAPAGGIYGVSTYISATQADLYVYVTDCSNTGAVTGNNQTGGILGYDLLNLVAYNCTNSGAIESTTNYAGGVFGRGGDISFTIISCTNEATATVAGADGQIGGVMGYGNPVAYSEMIDCTNNANITNSAAIGVSGISYINTNGSNGLLIKGCINNGDITSTGSGKYTAGISERLIDNNAIMSDCVNTGAISGKGNTGGIIARVESNPAISNCLNVGNVTGVATAGIVANNKDKNVTISYCINEGDISGTSQVGGIVGYSEQVLTIEYCLNDATVSGGTSGYCGGIISRIGTDTVVDEVATIKNCVNNGFIDSKANQGGGMVSYSRRALYIENCYNYGTISSPKWSGGMVGYQRDLYADYINCINYGEIVTDEDNADGIAAGMIALHESRSDYTHVNTFVNCGNEGNITAYLYSAGIAAQVNVLSTAGLSVTGCYNTGTLTATHGYVAGLVANINKYTGKTVTACDPEIKYNYISGTLTPAAGSDSYATIYNNIDTAYTNVEHNYIQNGTATKLLSVTTTEDTEAIDFPTGYQYYFEAADLESGKLANDINTAVGSDVFYETLGTDTYPTTNNASKAVRLNTGVYTNLKKASFIKENSITYNSVKYQGVNEVVYIDTTSSVAVPENADTFYWYDGTSDIALPNTTIQISTDKTFNAVTEGMTTGAGASVRMLEPTGLRFSGVVTDEFIAPLEAKYGSANVTFGMIIAPTAFVTAAANEFTIEALDTAEKTYNIVPARSIANSATAEADGYYGFNCVLSNVKSTNFTREFSAITYVKINSTYIYAQTSTSRSIEYVAEAAFADISDIQKTGYQHVIESGDNAGKFSPYTKEQRELLDDFFTGTPG